MGVGHTCKIKYTQGKWKNDNRLLTLADEVRIDMDEENAVANAHRILDTLGK